MQESSTPYSAPLLEDLPPLDDKLKATLQESQETAVLYPQSSIDPATEGVLLTDVGKHARSAVVWLASTTAIWQAVSWVITLITARILDPSDYGLVALAETVLPYLGLVTSFNLANWIIQADRLSAREERAIFTMSFGLGAMMSALAFLAAPLIVRFYERPEVLLPFRMIALIFLLRGLQIVPEGMLRRELRFKPLALMNLGVGISRVVLQLVLALLGFHYWALVIGIIYRDVACTAWLLAVRGAPRGFGWDAGVVRRALRFGLPATAATMLWVIFSTADNVIVAKFLGVEMLGFYSMAFFLTDMPMAKLNMIIRPVLVPFFSRLKGSPDDLRDGFLVVCRGAISLTYPVLAGLALVAPEAVLLVLGEKWLPMVTPLRVLGVVGLFRAFSDNVPPLFLAVGKPGKTLLLNTMTVTFLPAGFYFLTQQWGIKGIYFTWLFVYPVLSLITVSMVRTVLPLSISKYVANLKPPLFSLAAMVAVVLLADRAMSGSHPGWLLLATKVTLGVATYCGVMWYRFRAETLQIVTLKREVGR